jgi:Protein of unknown function (DUF3828)
MNIRIIPAVLLFLAVPGVARSPKAHESPLKFVQDFYTWYASMISKDHQEPAFTVALKLKGSLFSAELARALSEDASAQEKAKGEIVGIDWDPFVNSQDPESRYVVGQIWQKGDRFFAEVHGVRAGKKHSEPDVTAELMKVKGHWVFVNFHSHDTGDLLSVLNTLSIERQHPSK